MAHQINVSGFTILIKTLVHYDLFKNLQTNKTWETAKFTSVFKIEEKGEANKKRNKVARSNRR